MSGASWVTGPCAAGIWSVFCPDATFQSGLLCFVSLIASPLRFTLCAKFQGHMLVPVESVCVSMWVCGPLASRSHERVFPQQPMRRCLGCFSFRPQRPWAGVLSLVGGPGPWLPEVPPGQVCSSWQWQGLCREHTGDWLLIGAL